MYPCSFVSALAYDLGLPEDRAVNLVVAAVAAATRARLLDVSEKVCMCVCVRVRVFA
jgi:hypothetical protein